MDQSLSGYAAEVEPTMSDSDDDENDVSITQFPMASPRGVRRAESLEGPYSLLSLPLPTDAPDSARRGSDRDSPGQSYPVAASRSMRSLDQRLDELFAKGSLGDGMSPPTSISDRPSDIESDSLSEDELDIIKLRKPVTVTLQPGASPAGQSTASHSKSSDQKSEGQKADHVTAQAEDDASLTDDMIDEIVRMKPMLAKAARKPSSVNANSSPEDLSLKTHRSRPVDLSSKQCAPEKAVTSVLSDQTCTSAAVSTAMGSSLAATTSLPMSAISSLPMSATSSVPVSTMQSSSNRRLSDPRCRPRTVSMSQSPVSASNVQVQADSSEKRTETVSTLTSASPTLHVPSVLSALQCSTPPGTSGSTVTGTPDVILSCQQRASDQNIGQPVSADSTPNAASR